MFHLLLNESCGKENWGHRYISDLISFTILFFLAVEESRFVRYKTSKQKKLYELMCSINANLICMKGWLVFLSKTWTLS